MADPSSPSEMDEYHPENIDELHDYLLCHHKIEPLLLPYTLLREYRHWHSLGRRVWIDKARHLLPLHQHLPIHPSPVTLIRAPRGFGTSIFLSMLSTIYDSNQSTFDPSNVPWPPRYPRRTYSRLDPPWIPYIPLCLDLKNVFGFTDPSSLGLDDLSALNAYMGRRMFLFATQYNHYFKKLDNGMPAYEVLFKGPREKRIVNLLSRLEGCHLYVTINNINAFLYNAPPGREHEYDLAIRRLLVEPLEAIMKQQFFKGCMLGAITKSDAPEHVRAYDETGLGFWNILQAPDITSHPTISLLLGFRENEINAFDAFFPALDQSISLMDQVREENVASLSLDLQKMGYSRSYSMTGVLDILRRRTGQKDYDPKAENRIVPAWAKKLKEELAEAQAKTQSKERQREIGVFDDLSQSVSHLHTS